jgi:glycosyltransferase involved in cell wall biosynthesis
MEKEKIKLKVLHFMSQGSIGGQERAQYQLFKAFATDKEVEIGVALGRETGLYIEKVKQLGIPIINLGIRSGFTLHFKKVIIKRFAEYDIHHLHDPSPNYIIYSLLAGRKIKRVFTRRGGIFSYAKLNLKKNLKFLLKKNLLRRFDGFSGNSLNAVMSVHNQYGIKNKKIHLLYNGIDFKLLNPKSEKKSIREKLGFGEDDFLIGTACRLVNCKRIDLLIKAFSLAEITVKKLVIFGQGVESSNLQKLARELNISDSVLFTGEIENMADHLQVLDCFVLSSSNAESFGNAVVEAMYLRIPSIIMSDSDGLKEHITHMQTGFIAKDIFDLARLIEYIFSHQDEARKIAAAASAYVQEKYSFSNMLKAYKELYYEVLNGGH